MATIKACCSRILLSSGDSFAVINLGNEKPVQVVKIPTKEEVTADGESKSQLHNNSPKDDNRILASALSKSGKYLAVADDRKYLHLYTSDDGCLISSRCVVRRCTGVVFSQDETSIIVSDKSGDVYRFVLHDEEKEGELLLGHLSMLLDLILIKNDKFVVTSDRDEKMRISCYPNCYNIHSFCLGHTQYVSSMVYDEEDDLLISGSGDCTIRIWNYDGKEQYCQKCRCPYNSSETESEQCYIRRLAYNPTKKILAVCFGRYLNIEIYRLTSCKETASLELLETLPLEREIWDVGFDENGRLWVVQSLDDKYISVYNLTQQKHQIKVEKCVEEKICNTVSELNGLKEFFTASQNIESIYPNLRKVRIDNMTEYLQRKEKRIQGQKLDPPTYVFQEKKPKLS
ncbi:hypothetical protein SNE40_003438 [Patella caerulea]|uniref:tRNA (guanine-N(7)-)-methyltransferase non-catalytic subunit n=1 Tax=Patella caerulea TaxID=87958 RepID=A0AAN8Q0V5_PATCE